MYTPLYKNGSRVRLDVLAPLWVYVFLKTYFFARNKVTGPRDSRSTCAIVLLQPYFFLTTYKSWGKKIPIVFSTFISLQIPIPPVELYSASILLLKLQSKGNWKAKERLLVTNMSEISLPINEYEQKTRFEERYERLPPSMDGSSTACSGWPLTKAP